MKIKDCPISFSLDNSDHYGPVELLYAQKHWLEESEYLTKWQPIQDQIFDPKAKYLPDMMFNPGFELMPMVGGCAFDKEDFLLVKSCMQQVVDQYFVMIENYAYSLAISRVSDTNGIYRFKYPSSITWKELQSAGSLSNELLFGFGPEEFYIFGDSGVWGKYAANDYWDKARNPAGTPLEIIGYKKEYEPIFAKKFANLLDEEEKARTKAWLPPAYQKYTKYL